MGGAANQRKGRRDKSLFQTAAEATGTKAPIQIILSLESHKATLVELITNQCLRGRLMKSIMVTDY